MYCLDVEDNHNFFANGILVHNCQDSPRLQLDLIVKWSKATRGTVMAGDDDQAIYSWAGAIPEDFLALDVPEAHKKVLAQSYRVPRAVHAMAERIIHRVAKRQPKAYQPRDEDGLISRSQARWKYPEPLMPKIRQCLDQGKTVMVLASCKYMLFPLLHVLRDRGIPFHNPYRRADGSWNPLASGQVHDVDSLDEDENDQDQDQDGPSENDDEFAPAQQDAVAKTLKKSLRGKPRIMPVDRLLAYLKPDAATWGNQAAPWTNHDMSLWLDHIEAAGFFRKGGKEWARRLRNDVQPFDVLGLRDHALEARFEEIDLLKFGSAEEIKASLAWLLGHTLPTYRKKLDYPARIAGLYGGRKLMEEPNLVVGSGHSVKGGQADVVILFPDLSYQAFQGWVDGSERDNIRRLFYVMATRAREELVLCQASSVMAFSELR